MTYRIQLLIPSLAIIHITLLLPELVFGKQVSLATYWQCYLVLCFRDHVLAYKAPISAALPPNWPTNQLTDCLINKPTHQPTNWPSDQQTN